MKVLGFVGSPRREGNTARLVKAVLAAAGSKGAETKCFQLSDMHIGGCRSCYFCRGNTGCATKDDMIPVYDELFSCDAVVIGSPVYMWQMSGQTKLFVDRLLPVLNPDFTSRLARKPKLVLAFTQGQGDPAAFKSYVDSTAQVLGFLGFNVRDSIVAGATREPSDVEKQPGIMAAARAAGIELAS